MGLFITIIVFLVIFLQKAPICEQKEINKSQQQRQDTQQIMNKTRANVIMEYKMPIVYIWFGKQMPTNYQKRLQWITFPYKIIGQTEWEFLGRQFDEYNLQPAQKADILRLLYLQKYAGVYSDLDNIIDYECLMKMLARKTGFWMAGLPFVHWQPFASNLFLFVDRPKQPLLVHLIKKIKQQVSSLKEQDTRDINFISQVTGPIMLHKNGVPKINDIYKCLDHQQDSLWAK